MAAQKLYKVYSQINGWSHDVKTLREWRKVYENSGAFIFSKPLDRYTYEASNGDKIHAVAE